MMRYEIAESAADMSSRLSSVLKHALVGEPMMRNPLSPGFSAEQLHWFANPLMVEMGILLNRPLLVTRGSYMGLASEGVKEGDLVTVLLGGDMPFLLRKMKERSSLQFVGEAYVHGVMYGGAIDRCWQKDGSSSIAANNFLSAMLEFDQLISLWDWI